MNPQTPQDDSQIFETLLEFLRQTRGFDFTGYKRSSLQRRVTKQMRTHNIQTFGDYLDYLEVHPEEFTLLFNTILINVTSFFRDQLAWDYVWHDLLPSLLSAKAPDEPIRMWSAGCASGEEAYTLAMILAEILGPGQFRQRVKIYATDVDEEALAEARHASYSAQDLETIPQALRDKYFEPLAENYIFRTDLRRSVIFGRHDLVQDAPISRLDLLLCRNTLMYFNAETQSRILARFHFALNPSGATFLGKAEMLLTHANLFTPINLQHRIFSKVSSVNMRDRLLVLAQGGDQEAGGRLAVQVRLRDAAFNASAVIQLVVDFNGHLVMANHLARTTFNIGLQDLGRPLRDLEISYRPLELRSLIEQVYNEQQSIQLKNVARVLPDGATQFLDVQLVPLRETDSELIGVSISFLDVTRYHELQTEVQRSNQDLETANEELQSSNEELETTNEELQSTNEELETTNEELQSTNEELETMNEELQSTNEELQTINDELQLRTDEANQANAYLNSILASIKAGVAVLDRQFNILTWNQETEDFWGLRTEEVEGQSFWNLDIGLPVDQLRDAIRSCLNGENRVEVVLDTINRRGQSFSCRVTCTPLIGVDSERQGVILLMEAA
ncbi:PAS domain-containing protein [Leptolyngbya cf. ectocarpi LEGE 11479]|uniref:protein-glutamate O-methyltransferase n=1 Tax=Leptolyngbya cf. ectocarpi LEGE 11479 TaxID=1828722 RepID=A0A929FAR5_LEPEC|nr:CheR family methyltransferase [Leptolyngbya ectocarpi]MBE9068394.1 PAS domain-containing protein [Leptolyngbya cf. ectocarpi LEGE 11479]